MNLLLLFVALGGFSTGLVVGVVLREALELIRTTRRKKPMASTDATSQPQRRRVIDNILLVALFAVVILQAGVGLALLTTRSDLSQTVACQSSYNQQFSEAYRARSTSALNSRDKLDDFLSYVFKANKKDPSGKDLKAAQEKALDLLDNYLQAEKKFKQQPFPPLPNTYCDRF